MTGQARAKKGGEIGTNGEFYEGGKFLPTTEKPKRHGSGKRSTGREQYEPYTWAVPPADGLRPVFRHVGVFIVLGRDGHASLHPTVNWAYFRTSPEFGQNLADAWNAGMRWETADSSEFFPHADALDR